eukprot:3902447-Amphidinium_carterae.1
MAKSTMIAASFAAAATPALAFQASNAVHNAPNERTTTMSQNIGQVSADVTAPVVSDRAAVAGVATVAAAAVLMAHTRKPSKAVTKIAVRAFANERGVQDP